MEPWQESQGEKTRPYVAFVRAKKDHGGNPFRWRKLNYMDVKGLTELQEGLWENRDWIRIPIEQHGRETMVR